MTTTFQSSVAFFLIFLFLKSLVLFHVSFLIYDKLKNIHYIHISFIFNI